MNNLLDTCNSWNDQKISRFVRETLGCGCPDEVFQKIDRQRLPEIGGVGPICRLLIGERLLIYLIQPRDWIKLRQNIDNLSATGRADRDSNGYNRFRLVVVMPNGVDVAWKAEAEKLFTSFAAGDEKLHLHLLEQY